MGNGWDKQSPGNGGYLASFQHKNVHLKKKSKNNKTPEDTKRWGDTGVGEALV